MNGRKQTSGFTLVELLVVIGIIGVLVALLLPAIQAAREAARRVQCKNHVRQLALAAITHEDRMGHFPTSGWGYQWVGDPDRGFGEEQPGSWAFNILPFLEEAALHDLASDGQRDVITEKQLQGAGRVIESPIAIVNCPSRRPARVYAYRTNRTIVNAHQPDLCGKLDYAINAGETLFGDSGGPVSLEAAQNYLWTADKLGYRLIDPNDRVLSGVSFRRSQVGLRHVTDGASNTYLIGEKRVNPGAYYEYAVDENYDGEDNVTWCSGGSIDSYRMTAYVPMQDKEGVAGGNHFGSAHEGGCHMAYCDGSVRAVSYDVEILVHRAAGNRDDDAFAIVRR